MTTKAEQMIEQYISEQVGPWLESMLDILKHARIPHEWAVQGSGLVPSMIVFFDSEGAREAHRVFSRNGITTRLSDKAITFQDV